MSFNKQAAQELLSTLRLKRATLASLDASHDQKVRAAHDEHQAARQGLAQEVEDLTAQLIQLAEVGKASIVRDGRKSVALTHGRVGWRLKKTLAFPNGKPHVISMVKLRGHTDLVKVTESLDETKLAALPRAELRLLGVDVSEVETAYVTVDAVEGA